jgi:hypothetical protein
MISFTVVYSAARVTQSTLAKNARTDIGGFFLVHLTMVVFKYLSEKANASAEDAFFNQRQL